MSQTFTVTLSDELANRLQAKYGTLAAVRDAVRLQLRTEIMNDAVGAYKKAQAATLFANLDSQVAAEQARLDGLL